MPDSCAPAFASDDASISIAKADTTAVVVTYAIFMILPQASKLATPMPHQVKITAG